ncbi:hypothetical protein BKA70DRAFT_1272729, partial [Coprinopsis sp. MPI-PUGE-AT-0042]
MSTISVKGKCLLTEPGSRRPAGSLCPTNKYLFASSLYSSQYSCWLPSIAVNRNDGNGYLTIPVETRDASQDRSASVISSPLSHAEHSTDVRWNSVIEGVEDLALIRLELTGSLGGKLCSRTIFIQDLLKKPSWWNTPNDNTHFWVRNEEGLAVIKLGVEEDGVWRSAAKDVEVTLSASQEGI